MSDHQTFSLRWNDYSSYVASAIQALRHEEDLMDVTLYCEGGRIRAHKLLLSACSTYFKDIFKENPCQHPVIIFKNVKYLDLNSLVHFMYHGEVSIMQESLLSFLHTANMLAVRGLSDTPVDEQPISLLAQQILETQSPPNMNSDTSTTDPVYAALPSDTSSIAQQPHMEPQTSVSRLFINKTLLKSTQDDHTSSGVDSSPMTHVPQQQLNCGLQPLLHIPTSSHGNAVLSTNTDAMIPDSAPITSKQEANRN
uniref:BTB domain-containing protein n=1 Tax=Anopheles maculatus TaxID=74869 RepID=A0A182S7H9_9DIPT